ncbi:MAG: SLC13 family permease, partial [bacterium]
MQRWGLHRRVALGLIGMMGTRPSRVIAGFLLASAFVSLWVSNTATAMMMLIQGMLMMRMPMLIRNMLMRMMETAMMARATPTTAAAPGATAASAAARAAAAPRWRST